MINYGRGGGGGGGGGRGGGRLCYSDINDPQVEYLLRAHPGESETQVSSPICYQLKSDSGTSSSVGTGAFLVPDKEVFGEDCDEIRLKLRELERELLNDSDDDVIVDMDVEDDWVIRMKDLLLPATSPKESSSNDSNICSSGSWGSFKEERTTKELLFSTAAAISDGNPEEAGSLISEIRHLTSIQGDPLQRLAAYLVEGLVARISASGQGIYKNLRCKEPPTSDQLSAMQILFEICPCFKLGIIAANGAIVEAIKDESDVHIVDFDLNQGGQYITLIQTLSKLKTKTRLRITGVDDPESVQRSIGGLNIIGKRLEKLAEELRVQFEFRPVASKTEDVTPSMLACRSDEALVVNFAYQLHHMPDESVSVVNQRDRLLRMVKGLNPKLVTLIEQDANTNTKPFLPRFKEVYDYYRAVFESLDATMPRDSPDRLSVEMQCLARDIVNIVACEGTDRIERYEASGKWKMRMNMAGFVSCSTSMYLNEVIRAELKLYCNRYKVKDEGEALYFGWEDKFLVVATFWK